MGKLRALDAADALGHLHLVILCLCHFRAAFSIRIPRARLALVGTGPDAEALKEYFAGTKTVLTGIMTGDDLSQAFASADVFVMPSDSETLGFVVLESMASGVPVVGAKAGGIPDLIADGEVRFFFSSVLDLAHFGVPFVSIPSSV